MANYSWALFRLGDVTGALDRMQQALVMAGWRATPETEVSRLWLQVAAITAGLGLYRESTMRMARALQNYERELKPIQPSERESHTAGDRACREALGEDGYDKAVREGRALEVNEVRRLVLGLSAPGAGPR